MAAEKTTKKTPVKKADKQSEKSLLEQLAEKRNDLLEAQKSHRSGELVNPRILRTYRRDIARLMTAISAEKVKESK